jgi:hypothetical protein
MSAESAGKIDARTLGGLVMASVTEATARVLEAALGGSDEWGDAPVARVVRSQTGWSLQRGREMPGDECVEWEGRTLLALDPEAASALADTVLDVEEEPMGLRLFLTKEKE